MSKIKLQTRNWQKVKLGTLCSIDTGEKDVNEGGGGGKYPLFPCELHSHFRTNLKDLFKAGLF